MGTSAIEPRMAVAASVDVSDDTLVIHLVDERTISAPLTWYPRLFRGEPCERSNWRLIGQGEGIHWPDLDEDISVEHVLLGRPSRESQVSLTRWMEGRPGSPDGTH